MCKRNNIQVIVEQLPEPIDHPIYDKEYWNSFLFYMNSFRNYGNVIIVTDIMKYPDSLFRDVMHANDKGSKKYSLELSKKNGTYEKSTFYARLEAYAQIVFNAVKD